MLTPRNVILAALAVILFSLAWRVVGMLGPPDSGGRAADSYGTRADGVRGLYETLAELGVPVSRSLAPPDRSLSQEATQVLWNPHANLVAYEPRFLDHLGDWVRDGGRLVVTPPLERRIDTLMAADGVIPVKDAATTLWEGLGIDDRSVSTSVGKSSAEDMDSEIAPGLPASESESTDVTPQPVVGSVAGEGSLATLASDVRQLATPDDPLQTVDAADGESDGQLMYRDAAGKDRAVVRSFAVGEGEVVVVGDSRLLSNQYLGRADNSVLAVRLLMGDRQRVEFNEFYHGLSVRGNPLWLLTRRGYALLASAVLVVVVIVTWRSAVLLGPPLTTPEPSRRTIAEYIDAMSQFLNRGSATRLQLLRAVYDGTLRRIASEFGVTHDRDDAEIVAAAVARRDRDRATRLKDAAAAVDGVLAKHDKATEKETVLALRQLQNCLPGGTE